MINDPIARSVIIMTSLADLRGQSTMPHFSFRNFYEKNHRKQPWSSSDIRFFKCFSAISFRSLNLVTLIPVQIMLDPAVFDLRDYVIRRDDRVVSMYENVHSPESRCCQNNYE